jgi:hypothetical protein
MAPGKSMKAIATGTLNRRILLPAVLAMLCGVSCKDPADDELNRCIALEAKQDWAGALEACESATRLKPTSAAGQLAKGKAGLLREKVAVKAAWEEMKGGGAAVKPALTPEADVQGAVAALRTFWPIARQMSSSNFRLAGCQDGTEGYAAFKQCLEEVRERIDEGARFTRSAVKPTTGCAHEISSAIVDYVDANEKWIMAFNGWLAANEVALRKAMIGRPLTQACRGRFKCDAQDLNGPTFESASAIQCTKAIFSCGSLSNVCWVNKVADRLGIGDGRPGALTVRATGAPIR